MNPENSTESLVPLNPANVAQLINQRIEDQGVTITDLIGVAYEYPTPEQRRKARSPFDNFIKGRTKSPLFSNLFKYIEALGGEVYIKWNPLKKGCLNDPKGILLPDSERT